MAEDTTQLLNQLEHQQVLRAIERLDIGEPNAFSESTAYDVLYLGKRYPPKRVAGMALTELTGRQFGPDSFKGGLSSPCFRALQRCGFTVVSKIAVPTESLTANLSEVLSLQTKYSSANTPDMQRRGELIRQAVPDQLRSKLESIEPIFTRGGYSCEIEGSDGVGRKNESPWVRIFDPFMSPSATQGWYVVLHFSRLGDKMYATVGCGATTFHNGSLVKIPAAELKRRVDWARSIASSIKFKVDKFSDPVQLNGNSLSRQFEQAIAYAKSYPVDAIEDQQFWDDLQILSSLLVHLYEFERLGKDPTAAHPEVQQAESEIEALIRVNRKGLRGQGRGLSHPERVAVELQAMTLAKKELDHLGFVEIKDVSKTHSCDFMAIRDNAEWLVEVKGTTSDQAEVFLLTASELNLHRSNKGKTVLILVSEISLKRGSGDPIASGGMSEVLLPWDPDEWSFDPTAFRASRVK